MRKKKILIIQIRPQKDISCHDYQCYQKIFSKQVILKRINLYEEKLAVNSVISGFDGVIIGGSSFSVRDNFPQKKEIYRLIRQFVSEQMPFLGICFGFQMLVEAMGGKVIYDKKNQEFGSKSIYLTEKGEKDVLFHGLPGKNIFQEGHEWRVAKKPKEAINLAKSNQVYYQAVRIKNTPVVGVQFHPEMDKEDVAGRMRLYNRMSAYSDFTWRLIQQTKKSSAGRKLLLNFIKYIV